MARCCGSSTPAVSVANYAINHGSNQMEITLTNGQTFSISKEELVAWLGSTGSTPTTGSDDKVSDFDLNSTTNQLEVKLANGDTFTVSREELVAWLAPSINASAPQTSGKPTGYTTNGSTVILQYADGSSFPMDLNAVFASSHATTGQAGTVVLGNRLLANDGSYLGTLVQ